ncbi:uncharacterized protein MAM_00926 [Metarhizium album ARSEF 1941]|uniref:Uncharacterized protein n=1 Tax=Metarhizium album (strain ARSEF 1941) TaxID=1081103 RepID=A0A0B2X8Q5_METAS|nr:uncharacterized protein MAM_00926 [Metarhizium album ARSEF 1941]KHO01925.1 hypothetical protein MAM_00926 [Metarhizium album ARSEF 1941]
MEVLKSRDPVRASNIGSLLRKQRTMCLAEETFVQGDTEARLDVGSGTTWPCWLREWARAEAKRRVECGEEDVVIYHIETQGPGGNLQFRRLESLLWRLGIPEYDINRGAQALLDHECLFLYEIPEDAVVS